MCTLSSRKVIGYVLFAGLFSAIIAAYLGPALAQEPGQQQEGAIAGSLQQWHVLATSPGVKVLSESYSDPGKILPSSQNPREVAQDWLMEKEIEEGRNMVGGKLIYISIGSASINARPADPGFIDSRYLAFQRAELEAKAKAAIFLGVDLTTERGTSEREINPQERAELETIVKASPTLQENAERMGVKDSIYSLFQKTHRLAEAKLDQALEKSGVDVAQERKETKRKQATKEAQRDKMKQLRNISETSMKTAACAFAEVQGTQVIQTFEGSYKNNYQVVVISLWSHNMQRLVEAMSQGAAPRTLSRKQAKEDLHRQLPQDPQELACLMGVRAYINQDGETVMLAFGQAGVEVLGGREDKAFELAGKKARLRAMSAMRSFIGEKVAFSGTEELREVLALYATEYQQPEGRAEYRSISQFQETIQAAADKQKITGLHGLLSRELTHPFTDKPMVLEIMAWSPSSQAMAEEVKRAIHQGTDAPPATKTPAPPQSETPARKGVISSGAGADKDAW